MKIIYKIDGGLNLSETNGSVLNRSVRCAVALKSLSVQHGDVIALMAPNHIDMAIPYYAALYLGARVAGVDMFLRLQEMNDVFTSTKPKVVFCQGDRESDVETVLKLSNTNAHVVTFDKTFSDLLKNADDAEVENFKPTDFDPVETISHLTMTSGTSGFPKSAALTHKSIVIASTGLHNRFYDFPKPTRLFMNLSPIQWLTGNLFYTMSPILRYTRLQTSSSPTIEHIQDLINIYKPTAILMSPNLMTTIIKRPETDRCDFTSFENIMLGGSGVSQEVIANTKALAPLADVGPIYGISEAAGIVFNWDRELPPGSIGRPVGYLKHRIVDVNTLEDIEEPNVTGELWVKGPTVFKGYYNNPEQTKDVFTDDGWFKTGDLFYRDQYYHYFYVDRLKLLLKYRNHQISPAEVEKVILEHPGVHDVVVMGIPDQEFGDLPAAAVVPVGDKKPTAQEIKDWVKDRLTDTKQLRGGVVFMKEFPMTSTTKVDKMKLKTMVRSMERE